MVVVVMGAESNIDGGATPRPAELDSFAFLEGTLIVAMTNSARLRKGTAQQSKEKHHIYHSFLAILTIPPHPELCSRSCRISADYTPRLSRPLP